MTGPWAEGDTLSPTNLNSKGGGNFPDRTYHVKWAPGSGTTQITNAIARAAALGYPYCFIPKSMLPYDITLVTLNNAVRLVREGQGSWDEFDVRAYGASGDNSTYDDPAIQAALDAQAASLGPINTGLPAVRIPPGSYFLQVPLRATATHCKILGAGAANTNLRQTFYAGPLLLVQAASAAANVPTTTSLVSGSGAAYNHADLVSANRDFFALRHVATTDLDGLSAFTAEFFFKPIEVTSNYVITSSGTWNGTHAFMFVFFGGVVSFYMTISGVSYFVSDVGSLSSGTTYHIRGTFDGTTMKLYRGVPGGASTLVASAAHAGTISQAPDEEVSIGGDAHNPVGGSSFPGFIGAIDSYRLSDSDRGAPGTAPNTKFTNDANTLLLCNFDDQRGPLTRAYTKNSIGGGRDAWLYHGSGGNVGILATQFVHLADLYFDCTQQGSPPTASATGIIHSYGVDAMYERVRISGARQGLMWVYNSNNAQLNSLKFESCWRRAIYVGGTSGVVQLNSPFIAGGGIYPVQFDSSSGVIINPFFLISPTTRINLVVGTDSSLVKIVGGAFGTEGTTAPNLTAMVSVGAATSLSGIGFEIGNSASYLELLGANTPTLTVHDCIFGGGYAPPSILSVTGTYTGAPIRFEDCTRPAAVPWSNVTGTAVVGDLGTYFSSSTGSQILFDMLKFDSWDITLSSDVTKSTWSNPSYGQPVSGAIKMDSTGSRLFVWPTNSKGTATLSYGSSAVNTFSGFYDGVNVILTSVRTGL